MPTANCARTCWIAGAGLGVLVWFLTGIGPMGWFEALVLGVITAGLSGAALVWLVCRGEPARDGSEWHPAAAQPKAAVAPQPAPSAVAPVAALVEVPSSAAPAGQADERQSRSGVARNDIYASAQAEPDDLKMIKGVGPKLEELLHRNDVTRFAQIATWDEAEIDRMAELFGRMGGRIRSDDWVAQARVLAAGGETELSARVEDGEVY